MRTYLIEFEFPDRRQIDRTIALTRIEAENRARRLIGSGIARAARLIPLHHGRPIIVKHAVAST
jgi:hypothetical protein